MTKKKEPTPDQLELKAIMDRYTAQGWSNFWCESCGAIGIYCPECGTNECGQPTKDCGTCEAAWIQQEKIWAETDPIIERMTNGPFN